MRLVRAMGEMRGTRGMHGARPRGKRMERGERSSLIRDEENFHRDARWISCKLVEYCRHALEQPLPLYMMRPILQTQRAQILSTYPHDDARSHAACRKVACRKVERHLKGRTTVANHRLSTLSTHTTQPNPWPARPYSASYMLHATCYERLNYATMNKNNHQNTPSINPPTQILFSTYCRLEFKTRLCTRVDVSIFGAHDLHKSRLVPKQ